MDINKGFSPVSGGGVDKNKIPDIPKETNNQKTGSTTTPKPTAVKEIVDANGGSVTPTPTPTPTPTNDGVVSSQYPDEWLPDVDQFEAGQNDANQKAKDQADLQFATDLGIWLKVLS